MGVGPTCTRMYWTVCHKQLCQHSADTCLLLGLINMICPLHGHSNGANGNWSRFTKESMFCRYMCVQPYYILKLDLIIVSLPFIYVKPARH